MRYFKFDGKTNEEFYDFLKLYEKYILYTLLKPNKRFSSNDIYTVIKSLNENNIAEAKKILIIDDIQKKELQEFIGSKVLDNYLAKLLIARYFWIDECNVDDVVETKLNFDKATLEHIFPQTPIDNTNWGDKSKFSKKFIEEYTYKLGNMTLLTHKVNSTIKNGDFKIKKHPEYKKANFRLNVELGNLPDIDSAYIENRHKDIVSKLTEYLDI